MQRKVRIPLDQLAENNILAFNNRSSMKVDELMEKSHKNSQKSNDQGLITFGNSRAGFHNVNIENGKLSIVSLDRNKDNTPSRILNPLNLV